MIWLRLHRFAPYGITTAAIVTATLLTLALDPLLASVPYLFFFFAAVFPAWRWGLGPGLMAVLLSALCLDYFCLPPVYSLTVEPIDGLRLAMFAAVVLCLVCFDQSRRRAEHRQSRLVQELRKAMAEVGRLRNLLPICAGCKKIRDAGGQWNEVEAYLRRVAGSEFTHGLCPGCAHRLYGDAGRDSHREGAGR
jgi:hypothetical protein